MRFYHFPMAFVLLALFSFNVSSQQSQPLSIIPVKTLSIPANRLLVGGTVAAHKSVVFSAQMPGRIISISGEEGDRFKQGEWLVKINDDELIARRQTALAQYATAYSAINNARVQLYRQRESPLTSSHTPGGMGMPGMFDQIFTNPMSEVLGIRDYGVERGADIYATRTQLDQAYYAFDQAVAQIRQIDTKLRDTVSIAPFEGIIVSKNIEVGDTVQPGQTLLVFENLNVLQIVVDVPGRLIINLQEGQLLNARVDGMPHDIEVRVSKIFPTSDPVRHTTRVKLTLPAGSQVSAGNYAEVWIPGSKTATQKRLLIPSSAVIERGGLPSIFVVNAQNFVELRLARVGDILPSGDVVILYGVKENERVLDKPPAFITSGFEIKQ